MRVEFEKMYQDQVDLLLDVLPLMGQFECFALKGGTAINLFIRDMPRLSVDIDLTYLPIEPREVFLKNFTSEMSKMKTIIEDKQLKVQVVYTKERQVSKLIIYNDRASIKVEPNLIIRGSVFDSENRELCKRAQDQFLKYMRVKTLSLADVYGGKICAALDRQHPRDLFDIKLLFESEGISNEVRQAFLVYLCSGNRPIHEMLNPKPKLVGFEENFNKNFSGMTEVSISPKELINIRHQLINDILNDLTDNERKFLVTLKFGEPDWSLLPISGIEKLPALRWKILNVKKMESEARNDSLNKLKMVLELT